MALKISRKQQLAIDLATDVLKWLSDLKLAEATGYVDGRIPEGQKVGDSIQSCLPQIRESCSVCAKGALFLSYVELKNKLTFNEDHLWNSGHYPGMQEVYFTEKDTRAVLLRAFGAKNLDLIEIAFEKNSIQFDGFSPADQKAVAFGKRFRSPKGRMKAICQNIIENKGVFKP